MIDEKKLAQWKERLKKERLLEQQGGRSIEIRPETLEWFVGTIEALWKVAQAAKSLLSRTDLAHMGCKEAYDEGYRRGMEESAKIADVSAEYYSKGMKREDGALNPTIGSAAQTSWDIARAIRLQRGEEGGK